MGTLSIALAGPIVGALGAPAAEGASALSDNGEGYDFAIGGHGFRLAIGDERKYERATAQFRKEQYDSSDHTGDQSLLGYWTRGQLSFHKGAGQRYAELGEDTDTRYWQGVGANPFVKGEVSVYPFWDDATLDSYTGITDCLSVDDRIVVLSDGRITYGFLNQLGTMYPTASASRSVTSMAVGGGNIYGVMSDKKIDRIGLDLTYPVVYGEQGFESGIDGFLSNGGLSSHEVATVAQDGTKFDVGTKSLKITWPVTGSKDAAFGVRAITGLTPGAAYTMVARVWCDVGTGTKVRPVALFNSAGTAVTTEGAWTTVSFTFTATASSHFVGLENNDLGASTSAAWMDRFVIYKGARTGYDDGSTPTESIYSHTETLVECHYVKDRLFVMDATGAWYQLAPNPSAALPVAITASDKVFTATTDGAWAVCDTPGPVLLANGNRIFAVTQDVDGLFPTLSSPIQVADLPLGESVMGMGYYLGFVVLVTTRGMRVAALGDSGITYGPRLTDWSVTPRRTGVARAGESAFVAADSRVFEINLSSQIGQGLEFGWAELPTPFSAATNHGVTQIDGSVIAWGGSVLKTQGGVSGATGRLETSYHRFGTLEPKKFHTALVRTGGGETGGTVTISKVTAGGAVVSLYTMAASDGEVEVTLRSDAPVDMLALRFDLTGDAKLLSYQLRALPAPTRQRMIRVPLALHDVERRGTTRAVGRTGGAWERLRELEALESSSSVVTYQDFRTGESGQCYIEQVAHEGDTPPGRQGDGFGGVVWVTLRAL